MHFHRERRAWRAAATARAAGHVAHRHPARAGAPAHLGIARRVDPPRRTM